MRRILYDASCAALGAIFGLALGLASVALERLRGSSAR